MNDDPKTQSRRERIMNSDKQLPGDQARADAEANEDFDAADSGNFNVQTEGREAGNSARREQINESGEQLPGDRQRAIDDRYVDEGDDAPRHREPEFVEREKKPSER